MLANRIGVFFTLVGGFLVFLGFLSAQSSAPGSAKLVLFGLVLLILGIWMWWRAPKPEKQPTGRFRILKKSSSHNKFRGSDSNKSPDRDQSPDRDNG